MKIVITGVTGFRNRGVEALVRPLVEHCVKRDREAAFEIVTRSPEYDVRRLRMPQVRYLSDAYYNGGKWVCPGLVERTRAMFAARLRQKCGLGGISASTRINQRDLEMPFAAADVVIISGGDLFSSDYGTSSLLHYSIPACWAAQRGVPVALLGQSIGRFTSEADKAIWRRIESEASLITLREADSKEYLTTEIGSDGRSLPVTADMAFLLEPDLGVADVHLANAGDDWVAVSISESICGWTGADYERHQAAWVALIRRMLEQWNVRVAIIPHVQEVGGDDRIVSSNVLRELGFDARLRLFAEDLSAAEFKGLISRCRLVVAERMHAAIAGFSTGVCTVPVSYSIKAGGITSAVLADSGLSAAELVLPLDELLESPAVFDRLDRIWKTRERFEDAIKTGALRQKQLAMKNVELLDALMAQAKRRSRS